MPTINEQRNLIVNVLTNSGFDSQKTGTHGILVSLKNRKVSVREVTYVLETSFDELVDEWVIFSNGFQGVTVTL